MMSLPGTPSGDKISANPVLNHVEYTKFTMYNCIHNTYDSVLANKLVILILSIALSLVSPLHKIVRLSVL